MHQDQLWQTRYHYSSSKSKIWLRSVRFHLFPFNFGFSQRIFLHVFIFNSIIMVGLQTVRRPTVRFQLKFENKLNEFYERGKLIKILVWEQSNTYRIIRINNHLRLFPLKYSSHNFQVLTTQFRSPRKRILEQFFLQWNHFHRESQFGQISMLNVEAEHRNCAMYAICWTKSY